ncbi:ArnT family glycosyltransferase [Altericroceibacterium endophyticum]|uniref:Glycosyltransferase RgtA/B/C/D-like domain-containing protein n=1 Tax=Altericroceibacterium endophyticum TaxID=1808508 RepID=A0A6I4T1Z1_9SPHN|nr:hypothetical protein [Altericroceibacterium endophyticum]MXO64251.1 hypothetical protein [Altericroceibacterium endophyticum]
MGSPIHSQHASGAKVVPWHLHLIALGVLMALAVASRMPWYGDPIVGYDEQLYSLIGNHMLKGALPFVDLWDRKPFGLFLINAIARWIGGPGPIGIQIMGTIAAIAGSWLTYRFALYLTDWACSCLAASFYLLLMPLYTIFTSQSEIFHVPFMLGMLCVLYRGGRPITLRAAIFAMLLGGLALQIKYTVLPQCIFFGCYALWRFWRGGMPPIRLVTLAMLFALIGLLPTICVAIFYWAQGGWDAFVFANFISFFDRVPLGRTGFVKPHRWLLLLAIAIPGLASCKRLKGTSQAAPYRLLVGWSLAALATVYLPGTTYIYYLAALIPCAVLLGLPFYGSAGPFRWAPAFLYLYFYAALFNNIGWVRMAEEDRQVAAVLERATSPYVGHRQDCLYVFDGPTGLYDLTESCLPTTFIYPDHLNNALETNALGIDQAGEVARILSQRPGAIITASEAVTPQNPESLRLIHKATATDYQRVAQIHHHNRMLYAWVRRDKLKGKP